MKGSLGLAAGVGIAAGIWSLTATPQSAYAITDISKRILSLNSLHLKGAMYLRDSPEPLPIELYAEQPDRCRVNGHINDNGGKIGSTDMIVTADEMTQIDAAHKTIVITPENAGEAKMWVAQILQGEMQLLMGPNTPSTDYKKLRSEKVENVATDIYEVRPTQGTRAEIWFNPATGLPVKTKMYRIDQDKLEHQMVSFDTIEADQPIPTAVFHPPVPDGYTVVHSKPTPSSASQAGSSGGFGNSKIGHHHIGVRYMVQLDGGDVLLCWSLYNEKDPGDDLKLPGNEAKLAIHSDSNVDYIEHLLHADATPDGWHWRWSLLRPPAPPTKSFVSIWINATDSVGNKVMLNQIPTIFRPDDLDEQIEALQRQTLPKGGTPMTVKQIEQAVDGGM